jgi:hypothetical protein
MKGEQPLKVMFPSCEALEIVSQLTEAMTVAIDMDRQVSFQLDFQLFYGGKINIHKSVCPAEP